jgi:tRNA-binding EMAP/Myf-like protein
MSGMRVIDYRRCIWGHNIEIQQSSDGMMRGFAWNARRIKADDELIWKAAHGVSIGKVVECEWVGNVDDMYRLTIEVIRREDESGKVLWP